MLDVKRKQLIYVLILVIFYTVGTVGIKLGYKEQFLPLSPFNLLLSFIVLLLSYRKRSLKLLASVAVVGVIGFTAELIGVHTGYLFGDYFYGKNLGYKLAEVPLIIAVNWAMLSLVSVSLFQKLPIPKIGIALLSASLMTGLDFLIEPVAMKSDFWMWKDGTIPVFNYVCWWLIAFPLHYFLLKRNVTEQNQVSIALLVILFLFFGILNF